MLVKIFNNLNLIVDPKYIYFINAKNTGKFSFHDYQ